MDFIANIFKFFYSIFHSDARLNKEHRDQKIIVSLTTIGFRIKKVHKVMLIVLNQTLKVDRIILYVDQTKFNADNVPAILKIFQKIFGVEIRFVEDVGPHTKYFWAMKEFTNDIIVTVDDDVRYPADLISELFDSYKKHPKAVSARRGHYITFDDQGEIKRYVDWSHKYDKLLDTPSMRLFATGVGGVLYPPKVIHNEVFNLATLKSLALKNDDIWLKFMQMIGNTPVVFTKPFTTKHIKGSQKVALNQGNVAGGGNDVIVKNLVNHYDLFHGENDRLKARVLNEKL